MGDTFRKVRTGEALRIPAQAYNAFVDAARYVREQERDQAGDALGLNFRRIRVKNTSGSDRARFHILGIDDPIFTPSDNLNGFRNQTSFKGVTPDKEQHTGKFAILLEPAKPNKIVLAQVTGLCPVQIDIANEDHEYADIKDGDASKLKSAVYGSARILWKAPGTGTQWAVVALAWPSPLILPGKITAVEGDGTGGEATYDAESTHGPKVVVSGASPVNRPFGDSDIEPAGVGDDCLLYMNDEGDEVRLIQLTETVKFDECDPQTQEANDGNKLRAEVDGLMQFSGFTAAEERDFLLSRAIKHAARHEPGGEDPLVVDADATTGSLRTLGTGAQQACAGNDPRLSDARAPSLHGETHGERGTDPVLVEISQVNGLVEMLDARPAWYRCTVNHTQIAVAASVASVTLFTLPARGVITATVVRVKVPFRKNTKGGPSSVTCSMGTTTNPTRWSDVQEVGPGAVVENAFMAQRASDAWSGNFNSSVNVQAQFFCDLGINLNVLEQGTAEIYILWAAQAN